jgi:hypothetical protein
VILRKPARPAVRLVRPATTPRQPLPFRQMFGHYVVTGSAVWAAYRIPPARWGFLAPDEQAAAAAAKADRWSKLAGRWVRERVLPQPFSHTSWAAGLDARTPAPLPDVHTCAGTGYLQDVTIAKGRTLTPGELALGECGCETWAHLMVRMQQRIKAGGMGDDVTVRLVSLGPLAAGEDFRRQMHTRRRGDAVRRIEDTEQEVFEVVSGPGWHGERLAPGELEWLVHRSVAPFVEAPKPNDLRWERGWDAEDLHLFTDDVTVSTSPFDRTTEVVAFRGGPRITRHVAVLSMGRLEGFTYPEAGLEPWTAWGKRARHDGQAFPIEWCNTVEVMDPARLVGRAKRDLNVARQNLKAYDEVGADAPPVARRLPGQAERIYDAVADGALVDAVRVDGPFRVAVAGDTPGEALERARALVEVYRRPAMRVELQHTRAQAALVAELVPGGPVFAGHRKQMDLTSLAYGDPATSNRVGDRRGSYLGFTTDGTPWLHDSFYATERRPRRTNVHGIACVPGGGKSVLLTMLAYVNTKRGIDTFFADPSGMAGRLCSMPELAPHAVSFDILSDGEPGILNPPGLIPDPTLAECDGDEPRWRRRLAVAEGERRDLVVQIANQLMPSYLYGAVATQEAIGQAAQRVTWERATSLWDLIDVLAARRDDHADSVARALVGLSEGGKLALLFPPRGEATDQYTLKPRTLTVVGSQGLHLPDDGISREDWTPAQHAAVPLTSLSVFFTSRAAYDKPMGRRSVLLLDELHEPMKTSAGRALYNRLARDSSKWNTAIYAASQDPADILAGDVKDYLASVTVGRLKTAESARRGLELLGVDGAGHVSTLQGLDAGEFVHADIDGQVARVRADIDYYPGLKPYAFTDPKPAGSADWDALEVLA